MTTHPTSNRRLAAAALCALAVALPAAGSRLRLRPPLEADAYVRWSSDPGGLDLAVGLPAFDPDVESPPGFDAFDLGALRDVDQALLGLDELPVRWIRLPIPEEGALALEVFELRFRDGSVATLEGGSRGVGRHRAPALDPSLSPPQPLALDGVGFDGQQRFAYLRLMPVLRSLDGGPALVLESARARLHVGDGVGRIELGPDGSPGLSQRQRGRQPSEPPAPDRSVKARLGVSEPGLQVVGRAALEAVAAELLEVPPERLRLRRDGHEVARRIVLDGLGALERVEFVGGPRLGEQELGVFQAGDFTDVEVFFLEAAPEGESGRDIGLRGAAPIGAATPLHDLAAVARIEENGFFYNTVAVDDFDHWAWGPQLRSDGSVPAELAIPLDLPGLDVAGDGPVSLRVLWHGRGQPELDRPHRTQLRLGGAILSEEDWEGFRVFSQQAATSAAAVAAAGELVAVLPGLPGSGIDGASLDHAIVGYRRLPIAEADLLDARVPDGESRLRVSGFGDPSSVRAFDLSNPDAPVELLGAATDGDAVVLDVDGGPLGRVLRLAGAAAHRLPLVERSAPEDLLSPASGADWIAIVPEALADSARLPALVAARSSGGWTPRLVALQDVFDLFSFGRPDPRAVPRFLSHALASWPAPRLEVLLLVGDGSQDYKGQVDVGGSLVPAQLFSDPAERWRIGHHAGDSRAAAVLGADVLPEVAVGRVPARDSAQLDDALEKILAAEAPPDGIWRRRIVLAADDSRPGDRFGTLADALASATPLPNLSARIGGAAMLRDELPGLLGDGGAAVLLYLGHGGIDRWSPPGAFGAPYLAPAEVPLLQPGGPWPIVVDGGSLFTGAYHHEVEVSSLQEVLLLARRAGSAGGLAPSGDLSEVQGRAVIESAHAALFGLDRVRTLGELAERVRRELDQLGGPRAPQAVAGLVVFGDPAMPLALPTPPGPPWLTARGSETAIELEWPTPDGAPADPRYRLYRSDLAAGPYRVVADGLEGNAHDDTDVLPERTYHYRITLLDEEGFESPASNRAQARVGDDGEVVVFGCLPDAGPVEGGQVLRIIGRGFQPGAIGFLGATECLSSTWYDYGTLECVSPAAGHAGLVEATVVNPDLSSGERPRAYIYCPNRGGSIGPVAPSPAPVLSLASRAERAAMAAEGDLVVVVGADGTARIEPPPLRRPGIPRPDSFEPAIDPGLSRTIRFPRPSCGP